MQNVEQSKSEIDLISASALNSCKTFRASSHMAIASLNHFNCKHNGWLLLLEGLQSIFVMCFEVRSVLLSPPPPPPTPFKFCICSSCFPFPVLSQCLQLSHFHRIPHKHYYYYVFDFVCGRNGQLPSVAEWSNCLCITVCTFLRSAATAAHCHSLPDWTSCNWKVFIQPVCF